MSEAELIPGRRTGTAPQNGVPVASQDGAPIGPQAPGEDAVTRPLKNGENLRVLIWKHFTVRRRRFIHTAVEFVSPAVLFILWFVIWNKMYEVMPTGPHLLEQAILEPMSLSANALARVFYTPSNNKTDELMETAAKNLQLQFYKNSRRPPFISSTNGIWTYSNESEILPYFNQSSTISKNTAAVIFQGLDRGGWPKKLKYTIRMKRNFHTESYKTTPGYHEHFGDIYEDFVALQWAIDTAFIEAQSGFSVPQKLTVQHFPKPMKMEEDQTGTILSVCLLLCTLLSPLAFFMFHVSRLVQVRCSGIEELMKMIGVKGSTLVLSHIVNCLPAWLIFTFAGSLLTSFNLPASAWLPVLLMLFLFFAFIVELGFICSMILNKPNHAITLAFTVYLVMLSLGGYVANNVPNKRANLLILSGFVPIVPVHWFWNDIGAIIKYGQPLQWKGVRSQYDEESGTISLSLLLMLFQVFLLLPLAHYLSMVRPGKYGVAKSWDYFLQRNTEKIQPDVESLRDGEQNQTGKYFEKQPTNASVGIAVKNVSKIFGGWRKPKKVALRDVTLNMYEGEITVLLGHNGAGKTTLMSIITGMFSPTSGRVYIRGSEVFSQGSRPSVRKTIGLCPQHNLAFEDLTVREHFIFFAKLKGMTNAEAASDCASLLTKLRLEEKASRMSRELSGGMKRRLQLGCALAGDSDVLVLDEPTSGLDVETRRELWNLLLSLRGERTVLLTTHFMEEADALGDRVAALHNGEIRCHATPMYLKRAIGTGYRLSLTLHPRYSKNTITETVTDIIPDAQLKEATPTTISFSLPADDCAKFPELFNKLEEEKTRLDIKTMGVGVTTLEEVFLKLCSDEPFEEDVILKGANGTSTNDSAPSFNKLRGFPLWCQQFRALFHRQIKYLGSRNPTFVIWEIILPVLALLYLAYLLNGAASEQAGTNPGTGMNLQVYHDLAEPRVLHNLGLEKGRKLLEPFKKEYGAFTFQNSTDIVREILHEGNESMTEYNRLIGAVELNGSHANALYTTIFRHAMPVSVNLLTNMLAAQQLDWATDPQTITTINHPIESDYSYSILSDVVSPKSTEMAVTWAFCVAGLVMILLIPKVAISVTERLSESRHIHIMTGVPYLVYFSAVCLFHLLTFAVVALPTLVAAASLLDYDSTFNNGTFIGMLCFLVMLFAVAFTSFMYLLSYFANETGASSVLNIMVLVFVFIMPGIKLVTKDLGEYTWKVLTAVSNVFPPYTFSYGLVKMTKTAQLNGWCVLNKAQCPEKITFIQVLEPEFPMECCNSTSSAGPLSYIGFTDHGIAPEVIAMAVQAVVFWLLVYLLESGTFNRCWDKLLNNRYQTPPRHYQDPRVLEEKDYVKTKLDNEGPGATLKEDIALLHGVHKQYRSALFKPHLAVKDVSLSVKHGECFGLLGVNGAGKSTTFKMLTGSEHATRGRILASGYDIAGNRKQFLSTVTYCPQFGGLDEFLSGWDNVELMARLRGVPADKVSKEVSSWMDCVDLMSMKKQRVCEYSGGCTRRCATAAALVGSVDDSQRRTLALLDEPTAGVDPGARRRVWSALRRSLAQGLSVVISSHSMDETEALCDRIAIMSRGELGALGSAAALRAAHATGYSAQLKLRQPETLPSYDSTDGTPLQRTDHATKEQISKLKEMLASHFRCVLKDEHKTMLDYHIEDQIRYSELFQKMESIKKQFPQLVEDYTISETTLEEVFLSFAKDATEQP